MSTSSSPDYTAEPLESDIFEWHFTMRGPPNSPYDLGVYHGKITLPPSYPLRPPMFRFTTPNGRFEANREICLSISGHHEETWQPAWGIRTALVALRSFMETDAKGQLGGLDTTEAVRRKLAKDSSTYACPTCHRTNSDLIADCEKRAKTIEEPSAEVEVPPDLQMGWKDELASAGAAQNASGVPSRTWPDSRVSAEVGEENLEAELAEGFVQTVSETSPAARIAIRTHSHLQSSRTRSSGLQRGSRVGEVPVWLDRLIAAFIVILCALLAKVFLAK